MNERGSMSHTIEPHSCRPVRLSVCLPVCLPACLPVEQACSGTIPEEHEEQSLDLASVLQHFKDRNLIATESGLSVCVCMGH